VMKGGDLGQQKVDGKAQDQELGQGYQRSPPGTVHDRLL
jgi:hypothetical protein